MGLRVTMMPEDQSLQNKERWKQGAGIHRVPGVTEQRLLWNRVCPGLGVQKAEPRRKANHCRRVMPVYLANIWQLLSLL